MFVIDVGFFDFEDLSVNCFFVVLWMICEFRDECEDVEIVVILGMSDSVVGVDCVVV